MQELFFVYSAIGSASLGYFLMRLGFPKTQSLDALKKLGYGFLLGILVIVPSIFISQNVLSTFIIVSLAIFAVLGLIFYSYRIISNGKDDTPLIIEKTKQEIPDAVLTKAEKENKKVSTEEPINTNISMNNAPLTIKGDDFKDKNSSVVKELRKTISQENKINVENKNNETSTDEKSDLIKRLRDAAKGINDKKEKKSDEDLLEDISNSEEDEEEY